MNAEATRSARQRPVRWWAVTFGVLSALVIVCALVDDEVPLLAFVLGGMAYSAYLAFCGIGFALIAPRIPLLWLCAVAVPNVCLMLALHLTVMWGHENACAILDWILPVGKAVSLASIFAFTGVSTYGWIRYYRHRAESS